jgi:hypothetical protein
MAEPPHAKKHLIRPNLQVAPEGWIAVRVSDPRCLIRPIGLKRGLAPVSSIQRMKKPTYIVSLMVNRFESPKFGSGLKVCCCPQDRPLTFTWHSLYSKKLADLKAAVALYSAWHNFCRAHQTLRVTPAMESGTADHVWSVGELLSFAAPAKQRA